MSILSTILDKLGLSKPAAGAPGAKPAMSAPSTPGSTAPYVPGGMAPGPAPMAMVDVVGKLNALASKNPGLDWKVSIVDMMKLLGMDSSLTARKELAHELHYSGDTNNSAAMNVWLHKQVMLKLAENGGKVPDSLKA